jgi:hypothetical protein
MAYDPRAARWATTGGRRQSSAGLEEQRRVLEAAGREAWERATREGRNVQARTTDELRALGARALARAAGARGAAGVRNGERVVVTAMDDDGQTSDAFERREVERNVELKPNLNEIIDQAPGKRLYMTLEADWDPSQSSGVTAMPTPDMLDAGEQYKNLYTGDTPTERMGFFGAYKDGSFFFEAPEGPMKTGSSQHDDYASGLPPRDAQAGIHWHLNRESDGLVDLPTKKRPYGDADYLRQGKPMATVFQKEVGWHGLDNGRLVFTYPSGTLSDDQVTQMQKNLNAEQPRFYRKK